jgi:uncharacterized protein YecE (DUF72 family)
VLYPEGLPAERRLDYYLPHFRTAELNASYYRWPKDAAFERWRRRLPEGFRLSVKAPGLMTHARRLYAPERWLARLQRALARLGDRRGPLLVQLSPRMPVDHARLAWFLAHVPPGLDVAVEMRHPSWHREDVFELLERHGAALSWADRKGRPVTPLWDTADFGYLRLHEGGARPWPRYGSAALASWVDRINRPTWVFFNNDPGGAAVIDAVAFAKMARRRGCDVTRTP